MPTKALEVPFKNNFIIDGVKSPHASKFIYLFIYFYFYVLNNLNILINLQLNLIDIIYIVK